MQAASTTFGSLVAYNILPKEVSITDSDFSETPNCLVNIAH